MKFVQKDPNNDTEAVAAAGAQRGRTAEATATSEGRGNGVTAETVTAKARRGEGHGKTRDKKHALGASRRKQKSGGRRPRQEKEGTQARRRRAASKDEDAGRKGASAHSRLTALGGEKRQHQQEARDRAPRGKDRDAAAAASDDKQGRHARHKGSRKGKDTDRHQPTGCRAGLGPSCSRTLNGTTSTKERRLHYERDGEEGSGGN